MNELLKLAIKQAMYFFHIRMRRMLYIHNIDQMKAKKHSFKSRKNNFTCHVKDTIVNLQVSDPRLKPDIIIMLRSVLDTLDHTTVSKADQILS